MYVSSRLRWGSSPCSLLLTTTQLDVGAAFGGLELVPPVAPAVSCGWFLHQAYVWKMMGPFVPLTIAVRVSTIEGSSLGLWSCLIQRISLLLHAPFLLFKYSLFSACKTSSQSIISMSAPSSSRVGMYVVYLAGSYISTSLQSLNAIVGLESQ